MITDKNNKDNKQNNKTINSSNSKDNNLVEKEVLPLLSAKEAKDIVDAFTPEQELQVVADLIRIRVMAQKYTAQAKELNNARFIYNKLTAEGYTVVFDKLNNLNISWKYYVKSS